MKIRIWDLPLRLFHWLLVMAVIGSFVSVKLGGNAMIWHGRFGYLVLALIAFRIIWGFVGTHHARFAQFIKSPKPSWPISKIHPKLPGIVQWVLFQCLYCLVCFWLKLWQDYLQRMTLPLMGRSLNT